MKYIDADRLRAEIDKRYAEYRAKMKTDDFTYYEGMADALDLFEQFLDTLQEQSVEELKELRKEVIKFSQDHFDELHRDIETIDIVHIIARHFAEWGAKHAKK